MQALLLQMLAGVAAFAAKDAAKLIPYANQALSEIPADIVAAKPLVAFGQTFMKAWAAIEADAPNLMPSLSGTVTDIASVLPTFLGVAAQAVLAKL